MNAAPSDALVFFGATGDLAYKKIFPSLQAMIKRGTLKVPAIGVAKSGWTLEQLRARARDSIDRHVGLDAGAFDTLSRLLRYVDSDYNDAATYQAIRKELGAAQRPAHYLATELLPLPYQSRHHGRLRPDGERLGGEDGGPADRAAGEPPPQRGGGGCVRTGAQRRDGG